MSRLGNWFRTEREKLRPMAPRAAAEYIWQYYKLWIIGVISAVVLISFVVIRIHTTLADHWFYITFANTRADVGNGSELWQDYVDYTGYDLKEKLVEFNNESYFDYTDHYAKGNVYYEMFVAMTDAGTLDAVTMEPEALTSLGESGRLLDLNRDECASIRAKYQDRFLYALPYDTEYSTEPVPVGIDISDSILMTKYHLYPEGCALGIGAQSNNLQAVERFLDYIYEGVDEGALTAQRYSQQ